MISVIQNVHSHPRYCPAKPPTTGPRTGPIIPPSANTDTYLPLLLVGMVSAITPPPTVNGAAPAQPARNRKTKRLANEFARAQPRVKATKATFDAWMTGSLPQISDDGARSLRERISFLSYWTPFVIHPAYRGPIAVPNT